MNITAAYFLFGVSLLGFLTALSWIDFKSFRLPNNLTLPLIGLGLLQAFVLTQEIWPYALGAALGYLAFVAIEYVYKNLRKTEGLGRGDAKLLAAGGAWCAWSGLPLIVLIASFVGLILALMPKYRAMGRIPFGPCLAFAIFMVWGAGAYVALT